jgi:hypothetical protein
MSRRLFAAVICLLSLLALAGCTVHYAEPAREVYVEPPPPPPPPDVEFYELTEYGEWIDVHPFGSAWRPYVREGWRPYIYGHWLWTEWGWTWVSYEPFGWAVYHYGYWQFDPYWGWVWIPGYEWEPVRVTWLYYDDYVCWAPLPPPGYHVPDPWAVHTTEVWIVVHARNFTNYDLHRFRVKQARYKDKYRASTRVYRDAPHVRTIEKHTNRSVATVHVDLKDYKSGNRTYKKVVLPQSEKKVVDQYQPRTKKRVASPPDKETPAYKEKQKRSTRTGKSTSQEKSTKTKSKSKSDSKSKSKKDSGKKSSKQKKKG